LGYVEEIKQAKRAGARALKVIHGYGCKGGAHPISINLTGYELFESL
jgi:PII-like signaling protein